MDVVAVTHHEFSAPRAPAGNGAKRDFSEQIGFVLDFSGSAAPRPVRSGATRRSAALRPSLAIAFSFRVAYA
jgi:hypothetical protein